ncbi:hypothetical protein BT63DRAFT_452322 [Microthyrium microscopicum]|uniref:Uncharacterized protein n=1 Tax=Microthyrium microscopicum TaxID=703497 RepID=A0A6A6UHR4_9PEZI|nr:hypothetical protein BT63DRAFT_452322 [Microthyrium microscopicum]
MKAPVYIAVLAHLATAATLPKLYEPLQRRQAAAGSANGTTTTTKGDGATALASAVGIISNMTQGMLGGTGTIGGFISGYSIASMFVTALNFPYGKPYMSPGTLPTKEQVAPTHPEVPGSKTVKMRYGPYKVPSMGVTTTTLTGNEEGMLWNYPDTNIQKPCDDCMITGIVAEYEYLNGTKANIDSGQWLHHIVLLSSNSRADPTCVGKGTSLPHWVVGFNPSSSERFWASGNERTPINFLSWGIKDAGYRMAKGDVMSMIVDLMNMSMQAQTVYVVIKFDYFEGKPAGMSEVKPVWLDVDQCGFSEAKVKSQTGAYKVVSIPWKSTINGEILGMGGHIHDGGTRALIKVDGKVACDSKAGYGEKPEYVSAPGGHAMGKSSKPAEGHSHAEPGKPHISSMIACYRGMDELKETKMTVGQSWTVEAHYDYSQFAGATHPSGLQENVMGIALMYVRKT